MTVALLVPTLAWYVVLSAAGAARLRPCYDVRRWPTVFSIGTTATATLSVAAAVGVPSLRWPGRVLAWVAVAAWPAVGAAEVRTARAAVRSTGRR
ncbi:hypothetical protein [Streptomyces sp. MUSC 14]|uniref:hypothetical protein n=1 Tax=Streptomyces sp. MUSC 14 TaxID=1354889 RepID=UPI0011604040|nr:hypothetical protein [Streptomyces sp. MUSC 14]